ncbi:MAG: CBS domain-containing protein [Desulfurococcaceae archaeon]
MFRPKSRPLRQEHYRWMRDGMPNFNDRMFEHIRELEVIAKKDVNWISPTSPVIRAIEIMSSHHRSLIVLSSGLFRGLLTAMSVVNYLGGGELFRIVVDRYNYNIYNALIKEPVENIMERNPVIIYIDEGIREALTRMVVYGAGILPILQRDGKVYGILTEHDLVKYLSGVASLGLKVVDVMSSPVVTVDDKSTLKKAMESMIKFGFRRLPVVDNERVVTGLITALDIVRAFGAHSIIEKARGGDVREIVQTPVSEVMIRDLAVVHPEDDLAEAVNAMLSRDISSVLVVDEDGILNGIITERDILYAILAPK